jgi:exodeoxyribonuclease III
MEFEKFLLVCAYIPNAGDNLKRLDYRADSWDKDFLEYLKTIEKTRNKPVILAGDLNVAASEIDIYDPTGKHKIAGYTP